MNIEARVPHTGLSIKLIELYMYMQVLDRHAASNHTHVMAHHITLATVSSQFSVTQHQWGIVGGQIGTDGWVGGWR